jgi:hypothetical protein
MNIPILCKRDLRTLSGIRLVVRKAKNTPYIPNIAPDAPALFAAGWCHQRLVRLANIPVHK